MSSVTATPAVLSPVTPDEAERFLADVSNDHIMVGAIITPRSGGMPARMKSLWEVGAYLEDYTDKTFASISRMNIHHLDYAALATWVRDEIGDTELADAIEEITSDGRVFGQLSGEVKALIESRVAQCNEVLGITETRCAISGNLIADCNSARGI